MNIPSVQVRNVDFYSSSHFFTSSYEPNAAQQARDPSIQTSGIERNQVS